MLKLVNTRPKKASDRRRPFRPLKNTWNNWKKIFTRALILCLLLTDLCSVRHFIIVLHLYSSVNGTFKQFQTLLLHNRNCVPPYQCGIDKQTEDNVYTNYVSLREHTFLPNNFILRDREQLKMLQTDGRTTRAVYRKAVTSNTE